MPVLERFIRKTKPTEVLRDIPEEQVLAPEIKPYASTMLGAMQKLVNRLTRQEVAQAELQTESQQVSGRLLELSKEGVEKMKQWREKSGQLWEGKVSFGPLIPFEQDGFYSWDSQGVDIRDKNYIIFSIGHHSIGDVAVDSELNINVGPDLRHIFEATYVHTKTFSGEKMTIECIKITFEDNIVKEFSTVETPKVPDGLGSFYKKPEGVTRETQIKFTF